MLEYAGLHWNRLEYAEISYIGWYRLKITAWMAMAGDVSALVSYKVTFRP